MTTKTQLATHNAAVALGMLSFEQTAKDNKRRFVKRLMEAGWTKQQASKEYERIQQDEETQ